MDGLNHRLDTAARQERLAHIYVGEANAGTSGAISVSPFAGTCSITGPTDDSSKST